MQTLTFRPCQCLLACLLACLGTVIAPLCLAQEEQRWFRVELMVFTQQGADSGEQWDPTPTLVYPNAGRFLVQPAQVTANLELYHADSIVDAYGRQILTERAQQETSTDIDIPLYTVPAIPADPNMPQPLQPATAVLYPTPFVALPAAQQEFRGKAAYMQRSGRYRDRLAEPEYGQKYGHCGNTPGGQLQPVRRRQPEPQCHADHRRHFWNADGQTPYL